MSDTTTAIGTEQVDRIPHHPTIPSAREYQDRFVGRTGVVWDGITYASAELLSLRARSIGGPGHGPRVRCMRDPNDLGRIHVIDLDHPDGRIVQAAAIDRRNGVGECPHNRARVVAGGMTRAVFPVGAPRPDLAADPDGAALGKSEDPH